MDATEDTLRLPSETTSIFFSFLHFCRVRVVGEYAQFRVAQQRPRPPVVSYKCSVTTFLDRIAAA